MPAAVSSRPTAYVDLLTGYLTGAIHEDALDRFDDLFEDTSATAQERLAFARFYLDAVALGDAKDALPNVAEVAGLLAVARA